MSTAFTTITADYDLQKLSLLNEIINAYSERRQAIGQSAVANKLEGEDIQAVSLWATMQDWVEDNASNFVDDEATIAGETSVPMLTLEEVRTRSGLDNGFRRVTGSSWPTNWTDYEDPAYTYGLCEAGDIIGPWLWVDLAEAFTVLKWSKLTSSTVVSGSEDRTQKNVSTTGSSSDHSSAWTAASWTTNAWTASKVLYATAYTESPDYYSSTIRRGKALFSSYPSFRPSANDIYMQLWDGDVPDATYFDFFGLGAEDELIYLESVAETSDTSRSCSSVVPADGVSSTCELAGFGLDVYYHCESRLAIIWIAKWNFTYCN